MQAGRDLDLLIATKLMGVNPSDYPTHHEEVWLEGRTVTQWQEDVPAYSTDIAAAWELVEKLTIGVLPVLSEDDEARWAARAFNDSEKDNCRPFISTSFTTQIGASGGWKTANTAPLAICLAALDAVGVEVDG